MNLHLLNEPRLHALSSKRKALSSPYRLHALSEKGCVLPLTVCAQRELVKNPTPNRGIIPTLAAQRYIGGRRSTNSAALAGPGLAITRIGVAGS